MVQYTQPDGVPVYGPSDVLAPLEDRLGDMATATQVGLLRPGNVGSAASRDAAVPNPTAGHSVWRADLGWRETYLSAGVAVPGWFPLPGSGVMPRIELRRSAAQAKTSNNWELVNAAWGAPVVTTGGFAYAAGLITIPQDGLYLLDVALTFSNVAASANRGVQVTVNTATIDSAGTVFKQETIGNTTGGVAVGGVRAFRKGDTVRVFSIAATNANVGLNAFDTWAELTYIGPA